jgi:hypothetical protein
MKLLRGSVAALLYMIVPATAQEHPTIPGNHKKLAACVYRGLDAERPGLFRLTDLGDTTDLTMEVHGGGATIRAFKATFIRVSDSITRLEIGDVVPPGYFASKVRPLATDCTSRR